MSGGVDSAVAAARAVEAGHDVVGVHLALSRNPGTLRTGARGCCTIEDSMDARRAANLLGIPFYVWDFSERFKLDVVDDFVAEYAAGRTPNPCMRCNERIKFAALLEKALALGFDAVATGHYAEVRTDAAGNRELHRAAAWAKDQSYVLGVLTAEQLAHAMFPLGATPSKAEVRAEAAARGLSVAAQARQPRHLLHPRRRHPRLARRAGSAPRRARSSTARAPRSARTTAPPRSRSGSARGSTSAFPADDGKPRFVLEVRPKTNEVVVGPKEALAISELAGSRFTWAGLPPADPTEPFDCDVQVRAHGDPVPAVARVVDSGWFEHAASRATRHELRPPNSSSPSASPSRASPPARPPSSTSAPACSASARSTARSRLSRCPRCRPPHPSEPSARLACGHAH